MPIRRLADRAIRRVTRRVWHRYISRVLSRARENGQLNSHGQHALAAVFDPTQKVPEWARRAE